jgi:cephalosporin-C deacetylase
MAQFDFPLPELRQYVPQIEAPDDLAEFWTSTLAATRAAANATATLTRVDAGLTQIVVDDVTFPGFAGHPIRAWLRRPAGVDGPLAAVVEFLGYGGGRGLPHERLDFAAAGYAHLVMDTRGQGGNWGSGGVTPDPVGRGASTPGMMTAGIEDPHAHYYRRFFTDAARAVDAVRALPGIDPNRVAVTGGSQGGGASIAAAAILAMADDGAPYLRAAMPDVPFLCDMRRAVELVDSMPYAEITKYLSVHRGAEATVWHTLSYVDGANLAPHATAAGLFSVALMDLICPPSTVFAAYNRWGGTPKDIDVYPYNNHEGGAEYRFAPKLAWLRAHFA